MSAQPGTAKANIRETKAYAVAQMSEHVSLEQFVQHIATHGSVYDEADVSAILQKTVRCLREMLLEGKKVDLGKLGSFSVTLKCTGAETAARLTSDNITAVNVVWHAGKEFRNLRDDAEFEPVASREAQRNALEEAKAQVTIKPGDITD